MMLRIFSANNAQFNKVPKAEDSGLAGVQLQAVRFELSHLSILELEARALHSAKLATGWVISVIL